MDVIYSFLFFSQGTRYRSGTGAEEIEEHKVSYQNYEEAKGQLVHREVVQWHYTIFTSFLGQRPISNPTSCKQALHQVQVKLSCTIYLLSDAIHIHGIGSPSSSQRVDSPLWVSLAGPQLKRARALNFKC